MIIAVTGVSRAGKSTVAQAIAQKLDAVYGLDAEVLSDLETPEPENQTTILDGCGLDGIEPDLTILLDIPASTHSDRDGCQDPRDVRAERAALLKTAGAGTLVIDADAPIQEVIDDAWDAVVQVIGDDPDEPAAVTEILAV